MINELDFPLCDYWLKLYWVILYGFSAPATQTKIHTRDGKTFCTFNVLVFSVHARTYKAGIEHRGVFVAKGNLQEPTAAEQLQKIRKILQILWTHCAVTEDLQDMFFIFFKTRVCNRDEIGLDQQLAPSGIQAELKKRGRKILSL